MSISAVANEWLGLLFPGRERPTPREAARDILERAALRVGPEMRRTLNVLAASLPRHAQPLIAIADAIRWCDDMLAGIGVYPENTSQPDVRTARDALRKAEATLRGRG